MILCDHSSCLILKFSGVFPEGLNCLHDAIDSVNSKIPFDMAKSKKVELLSSKFSHEHKSYVVEIRVPYKVHINERTGYQPVPQSAVIELFEAVQEFQIQ